MTGHASDAKINRIEQIHLPVRNLKKATEFYRDTLGIDFMFQASNMAFFGIGGVRLMIGEINSPDQGPGSSIVYFNVADCDASFAKAQSLGGTVCVPPTDIPNVGRFAVMSDPQGAVFNIIKLNLQHHE